MYSQLSKIEDTENSMKTALSYNYLFQEFSGNSDRYTVVRNKVKMPLVTRYIRIHPDDWNGHISMRTEFYGCREGKRLVIIVMVS